MCMFPVFLRKNAGTVSVVRAPTSAVVSRDQHGTGRENPSQATHQLVRLGKNRARSTDKSAISAAPTFSEASRARDAVIIPPTVCPIVVPVGRIERRFARRREITVLVAPVSRIRLALKVRFKTAATIAARPANCTGTMIAPLGAAEARATGIVVARVEFSWRWDLKKLSSFLE